MNELSDHLQQIDLFSHLSQDALDIIIPYLQTETFSDGQIIMNEGEVNPPVYFVLKGGVRIFHRNAQGSENNLRYLQKGEHFNLPAAFLNDQISPASAAAAGDVTLYAISKTNFSRLASETPAIALAVLQKLSESLNRLPVSMHDVSLRSVRSRLAGFLYRISGEKQSNEIVWSQEIIARHIGSSQEVVEKTLRAFMQEGILENNERGIVIHDFNKLQAEIES